MDRERLIHIGYAIVAVASLALPVAVTRFTLSGETFALQIIGVDVGFFGGLVAGAALHRRGREVRQVAQLLTAALGVFAVNLVGAQVLDDDLTLREALQAGRLRASVQRFERREHEGAELLFYRLDAAQRLIRRANAGRLSRPGAPPPLQNVPKWWRPARELSGPFRYPAKWRCYLWHDGDRTAYILLVRPRP